MSIRACLAGACLALGVAIAQGQIIYVDASASGANNGTSWADAYVSLQTALLAAPAGSQIWVADGKYMPDGGRVTSGGVYTPGTLDRSQSFRLKQNVQLFGGFDGLPTGETLLSQRDVAANLTVLSGDLLNNDLPGFVNNADNSFHVVIAPGLVSGHMDGFTITAGFANNALSNNNRGAGLQAQFDATVTTRNCTFLANRATDLGGAAFFFRSTLTLVNCRFAGNTASAGGGAVWFWDPVGNKRFTNCEFARNEGGVFGGGAIGGALNGLTIVNGLFVGNFSGGGPDIGGGGAIHASLSSSPDAPVTLINCTVVGNRTNGRGGGLRVATANSVPVNIYNSIFWNNSDSTGMNAQSQISLSSPSSIVNTFSSLVEGVPPATDPLFVDPLGSDLTPYTGDENLRLGPGSPAIDAGDTAALPQDLTDADDDGNTTETLPIDLDGQPRVQCAAVDQGAYESAGGSGAIEIFCPADVTVACGDSLDPNETGAASASNPCAVGPIDISYSDEVQPGCGATAVILRTWTASDSSGSASCVQRIEVVDVTAPTLTAPPDVTLNCDLGSDPSVAGMATATDTCDAAPIVAYSDEISSGECPIAQIVTRTWTATDACGNVATAVQTISLVDTSPPTLECPADLTILLEEGSCAASGLNLGSPVAGDSCGVASVVNDAPSSFPAGATIVTWTATDFCGHVATCQQTVIVLDAQAPFLDCSVAEHMLWPPNHMLVNVGLTVNVDDDCDSGLPPAVTVYSDEDDLEGDIGLEHSPDARDIGPDTLRLRAERSGSGDGRVYLIVASAQDSSGNFATATCVVVVPHNRSKGAVRSVLNEAAAARDFFETFGAPPPGFVLVGDGPTLGPHQ